MSRGFENECGCGSRNECGGGCGGGFGGDRIPSFLRSLSPGIRVTLQYDHQRPACGIFQGFDCGNILLTEYDGFPGLVRIAVNRVNAVSVF